MKSSYPVLLKTSASKALHKVFLGAFLGAFVGPLFGSAFFRAALLLAFAVAGAACSKSDGAGANVYQIPWPTASGEYKIQNVTIDTFDYPEEMRGQHAKILIDPYVADGRLQSSQPVARFAKADGVMVPTDFASLQATAIYAHLERLFGVDSKVGVAHLIKWPMMIALQANVVDNKTGSLVNNALYDGRLDALLIVPYRESRLPISLNAGILAHEHFHKIFQSIVLSRIQAKDGELTKPAPADSMAAQGHSHDAPYGPSDETAEKYEWSLQLETKRAGVRDGVKGHSQFDVPVKVYNQFLVRGLNEGLADFWGWVYTGDSSFIGRSLKHEENELRRMDHPMDQLPGIEILKSNLKDPFSEDGVRKEDVRYVLAYRLGSYYARFMRELAITIGGDESNMEARLVVAKALMDSLPMMAQSMASAYTEDYISPNAMLKPLFLNLPSVSQAVCGLYTKFATKDDGAYKPTKCADEPAPGTAPTDAKDGEEGKAIKPTPDEVPPKEPATAKEAEQEIT